MGASHDTKQLNVCVNSINLNSFNRTVTHVAYDFVFGSIGLKCKLDILPLVAQPQVWCSILRWTEIGTVSNVGDGFTGITRVNHTILKKQSIAGLFSMQHFR